MVFKGRRKIPLGNLALREGGGTQQQGKVDRSTVSLQVEREMGGVVGLDFSSSLGGSTPSWAFQGNSGYLKSWHEPRGILWCRLLCYGQEFTARSQESSTAIYKGIYFKEEFG